MTTTLVFETPTNKECSAAKSILRHMGYGVTPTRGRAQSLRVLVRPGERPQAALKHAGIDFRYRSAEG